MGPTSESESESTAGGLLVLVGSRCMVLTCVHSHLDQDKPDALEYSGARREYQAGGGEPKVREEVRLSLVVFDVGMMHDGVRVWLAVGAVASCRT
jgi:hypothetical protein